MTVSLNPLKERARFADFAQGRCANAVIVRKWIAPGHEADDYVPEEFKPAILRGAVDLPRDNAGQHDDRQSKTRSFLDHEA